MNYRKNILLLLLLAAPVMLKAQTPSADTSAGLSAMAADLSVSIVKAAQIRKALTCHSREIAALQANNTLKPQQKQAMIKSLLMDRRRRTDSVMTPAQKALFLQKQGAVLQRNAAIQAALQQQHINQMNRVPHTRVSRQVKDSLQTKKG